MENFGCPVNYKKLNAPLIKFYSIIIAALLIMFLLADWRLPVYLVTFDFMLRVLAGTAYSPLCILLDGVLKFFKVCPRPVDAAAKQFAAFTGMLMMLAVSILSFNGHMTAARVVAAVMLAVVLAEVMAGFCVACRVYAAYQKLMTGRRVSGNDIFSE